MRNGQYLFIMSTKGSDVFLRGIRIQKKNQYFLPMPERTSECFVATIAVI